MSRSQMAIEKMPDISVNLINKMVCYVQSPIKAIWKRQALLKQNFPNDGEPSTNHEMVCEDLLKLASSQCSYLFI